MCWELKLDSVTPHMKKIKPSVVSQEDKYKIDNEGLCWERAINEVVEEEISSWGIWEDANEKKRVKGKMKETVLKESFKEWHTLPEPTNRQEVIQRLRYQVDPRVGKGRESIIEFVNGYSFDDGTLTRKDLWSIALEPLETRVLKEGKK